MPGSLRKKHPVKASRTAIRTSVLCDCDCGFPKSGVPISWNLPISWSYCSIVVGYVTLALATVAGVNEIPPGDAHGVPVPVAYGLALVPLGLADLNPVIELSVADGV